MNHVKTEWKCKKCGDDSCIFINPATDEKPIICPLKIDVPEWEKENGYNRYKFISGRNRGNEKSIYSLTTYFGFSR